MQAIAGSKIQPRFACCGCMPCHLQLRLLSDAAVSCASLSATVQLQICKLQQSPVALQAAALDYDSQLPSSSFAQFGDAHAPEDRHRVELLLYLAQLAGSSEGLSEVPLISQGLSLTATSSQVRRTQAHGNTMMCTPLFGAPLGRVSKGHCTAIGHPATR